MKKQTYTWTNGFAACSSNHRSKMVHKLLKDSFPLEWLHDGKFWINVARVDNAYGDRNLRGTRTAR